MSDPVPAARLRISVVGLFVVSGEVLLIHQTTPPEPDCWDLPGGGLEPHETLLAGLQREIQEETGLQQFDVKGLLTIAENFYDLSANDRLHTLNLIYQCDLSSGLGEKGSHRSIPLHSTDPEIGDKGIQWLEIDALTREQCSSRAWIALQVAGCVT